MDDERLKNPPGKGQTDYFNELLRVFAGFQKYLYQPEAAA